ncbi:MobA/MobL family protein [Mesorhizobium sp. M0684]|uniref:MobA/MobL family protein n=1 Tax=Mesorhizobium sp. M0684 TaxID=2956986 RepID=UPI00333698B5
MRSAAYNGREAIKAERTGEVFYFKNRGAPEHHEVLLPEGAPSELGSSDALWNAAEAMEKRKDAQLARELVLALPANQELDHDDRVELARSFALEHFVSKGLAVQLDVHAPHGAESEGERANYHAHLLITTRRLGADGFAAKKARDLDPVIKRGGTGRLSPRARPGDNCGAIIKTGTLPSKVFRAASMRRVRSPKSISDRSACARRMQRPMCGPSISGGRTKRRRAIRTMCSPS